MRYPCSEEKLMKLLEDKLVQKSGGEPQQIEAILEGWKKACRVDFAGSLEAEELGYVNVADCKNGDNLPVSIFRRFPDVEDEYNITDVRCKAKIDILKFDKDVGIKVTGEITGLEYPNELMMFVMVYNAYNELINYNEMKFSIDYDGEKIPFVVSVWVPQDEVVSAVEIRFREAPELF